MRKIDENVKSRKIGEILQPISKKKIINKIILKYSQPYCGK
jgi:hypothetical protein